jgi:flagellar export protein FliJ
VTRKNQLQTLRTLAETAERECARILAERRRQLELEERRLEQLRSYLDEYRAPDGPATNGVFADTIRSRQAFVRRICAGIEQQEEVLRSLRQQLDHELERWRDARTQALALDRYADRLDAEADDKAARREQGRLDEVGRQQHLARPA